MSRITQAAREEPLKDTFIIGEQQNSRDAALLLFSRRRSIVDLNRVGTRPIKQNSTEVPHLTADVITMILPSDIKVLPLWIDCSIWKTLFCSGNIESKNIHLLPKSFMRENNTLPVHHRPETET